MPDKQNIQKTDGGIKLPSNFVAMIVILVIWIGVFLYLFRLDRKVEGLRKKQTSSK